mgnify:CR=1 FL=1
MGDSAHLRGAASSNPFRRRNLEAARLRPVRNGSSMQSHHQEPFPQCAHTAGAHAGKWRRTRAARCCSRRGTFVGPGSQRMFVYEFYGSSGMGVRECCRRRAKLCGRFTTALSSVLEAECSFTDPPTRTNDGSARWRASTSQGITRLSGPSPRPARRTRAERPSSGPCSTLRTRSNGGRLSPRPGISEH